MIQIILRVRNARNPSCQQPGAAYILKKYCWWKKSINTTWDVYKTLLQKKNDHRPRQKMGKTAVLWWANVICIGLQFFHSVTATKCHRGGSQDMHLNDDSVMTGIEANWKKIWKKKQYTPENKHDWLERQTSYVQIKMVIFQCHCSFQGVGIPL